AFRGVDAIEARGAHLDHFGVLGLGDAIAIGQRDEDPATVVFGDVAFKEARDTEGGEFGLEAREAQRRAEEGAGDGVIHPQREARSRPTRISPSLSWSTFPGVTLP